MTVLHNTISTFNNFNALYHMTHRANISSILKHGLLSHGNKYQTKDISDKAVNSRRSRIEPIYGKAIHSYVPFYFNPKNAMLYCRREKQSKIVILVFNASLISYSNAIFTDGNASSDVTQFFNNLGDLNKLHWSCLKARRWSHHPDGRRTRMAEVLVPNHVGLENLNKIICYSSKTYYKLKESCPSHIRIEIDRSFYF